MQPGHVFPLRARPGGCLKEPVILGVAIDLASLAGLHPSGVICEILNEDGDMARLPELINFKKKWGYKLISIASLIEYRHQREQLIEKIAESEFNSEFDVLFCMNFGYLDNRLHYL